MSTSCKFQIDQINRKQDVLSFVMKPTNTHITLYIYIIKSVIYYISKNQHSNFNTSREIKCFRSLQDHNIKYTFIYKQNQKCTQV